MNERIRIKNDDELGTCADETLALIQQGLSGEIDERDRRLMQKAQDVITKTRDALRGGDNPDSEIFAGLGYLIKDEQVLGEVGMRFLRMKSYLDNK